MNAPTLFDAYTAAARAGDPETSHEAARSVKNAAGVRARILDILGGYGPCTDEEISDVYDPYDSFPPVSPSGLRTRRSELVDDGQVVDSGVRRPLRSGRRAIVWALA